MNPRLFLFAFLLPALLVIALPAASAQEPTTSQGFTVERSHPDVVKFGDPITISITVSNNTSKAVSVRVKEMTYNDFEFITPQPVTEHWEGLDVLFLEWEVLVPAGGEETVTYEVIPKRHGDYTFSPAKVLGTGSPVSGAASMLTVVCKPDNVCSVADLENYKTCPEDCATGAEDNRCDFTEDGRCDPDCDPEYDPDCIMEQPPIATPPQPGIEVYAAVILAAIVIAAAAVLVVKRKAAQA